MRLTSERGKEAEAVTLVLPLKTASLTNLRGSWKGKWARSKRERDTTRVVWWGKGGARLEPGETATVSLTRVAPRTLDSDNLPPSMKSIRDELATCLGVDDRDPRVTWEYFQEKGPYSVLVVIRVTRKGAA